jgi:toxin ParE1/3/4
MRVELSSCVERDLEVIRVFIAKHNPRRALSFVEELRREVASIGDNPLIYRLRTEYGLDARVATHGNYVIMFRILGDTVRVERVVNGYRNLAKLRN